MALSTPAVGLSPPPTAVPWLSAADTARLARYRQYLAFDAGRHEVGRLGSGGVPLVANYARTFVRKGVAYLMPEAVTPTVAPPDDTPAGMAVAREATRLLASVALDNDLALADLAAATDAGVLGDGAFKVTWDAARGRVRVVPADVGTLFVETAPDDARRAVAVRQLAQLPADAVRERYGVAPKGTHAAVRETWTAGTYAVHVDDAPCHDGPNPYGVIPYVIFPNTPRPHDFWGESDLVDVMGVNRALDRRLSVLAQVLELSGNPVTVLENVQASQGISVAPGAVWELPPQSRAYLLDLLSGGSAETNMRFIDILYRIMHDLAEMPRSAFGDSGGVTSGTALQATLQPLLQRTQRKRLIWTAALTRRAALTLALAARFGGFDPGPYDPAHLPVRVAWPPIFGSAES